MRSFVPMYAAGGLLFLSAPSPGPPLILRCRYTVTARCLAGLVDIQPRCGYCARRQRLFDAHEDGP